MITTAIKNIELSFEKDGSFAVKEFKALDAVVAGVFYVIFVVALVNTIRNNDTTHPAVAYSLLAGILAGGITFTRKALSERVYLLINKQGIYQGKTFITNWRNFVSAKYIDKQLTMSIKDNFVLVLTYYKMDGICYKRNIPVINSQNKGEEEVIAAMRYFCNLSKVKSEVEEVTEQLPPAEA